MPDLAHFALEHLGVLSLRGADAREFLQGQLSNDVTDLAPGAPLLGGLHNAQGRCLALLRVFALDGEQLLAVLPRELVSTMASHLLRYRLRAKLQIESADAQWRVYGLHGPDAGAAARTRLHMPMDAGGLRQLILAPRAEASPESDPQSETLWHAEDIASGLPQVFAATSGAFTAQMLNLDRVAALSMSKGCYTGQEIIARAHYLGVVKRRMRRFHTPGETPLAPGTSLSLDSRRARVVRSAPAEGGGQEFLAVTTATDTVESAGEPGQRIAAIELPLPYSID
jgi:folate-binding protein YgfZ